MFAKIVIFCAAFAAAQASLVEPLGLGAPVLAAGPLGYGKVLIVNPAVATVSSQRTAINHVAPAARIVSAAPLGYAGTIVGGPVLAAGPLGYGRSLISTAPAVATISTQRTAINHVAPAAHITAVAPIGYAGVAPLALSNGVINGNAIIANGLISGHGLASPLAIGNGLLGAHYGLGVGRLGLGKSIL